MTARSAKILLVDDDPDFLVINRSILEAGGYSVVTASSPEDALQILNQEQPALVITDLMMASLDSGFQLAASIRKIPGLHSIPIAMVTAASSQRGFDLAPRNPDDLRAMQVDAFIPKPVKPNDLLETVATLLEKAGGNVSQ